jgi:hypothetical protein
MISIYASVLSAEFSPFGLNRIENLFFASWGGEAWIATS